VLRQEEPSLATFRDGTGAADVLIIATEDDTLHADMIHPRDS
jgi:hypothetical protein